MCDRCGRKWSPGEERALFHAAGTSANAKLRRVSGDRSLAAISEKIRRDFGPGGRFRGTWSLRKLMNESGYSDSQLIRARGALGQAWRKSCKGGRYLISQEQVEDLIEWLTHDYWSSVHRLYACRGCGERKKPHRARGLCASCYRRRKES